mgnify:CR=1 FL=1
MINKDEQKLSEIYVVFSTGEKYIQFPNELGNEILKKYKSNKANKGFATYSGSLMHFFDFLPSINP